MWITPPHRKLELYIATSKGTEAALVFANGYATSLGALSALLRKGDTVILDKLSHASLIDGARLSGATLRVFPHNDLNKLSKILEQTFSKKSTDARVLIVTESIFSMDGDHAPLADIIALKQKFGALLLVDEAHGLGILGPTGMGLAEQLDCAKGIDLQMGTLGKAAGVAGGYIAATKPLIDLLTNKARSFIYSTAPPPSQSHAALVALQLIRSPEGSKLRQKLWNNLQTFADATQTPLPASAIIPWHVGPSAQALELSQTLQNTSALLVPAVRYPTVPRNTARLRITLTAAHSTQDIQTLAAALLHHTA
ncbi:aminotransferase class I/II-fold pyridoxal phosphate-dependent enzyme [Rubritalea tangerina]|uniref:aminotransferase class I/II-fold pyridoxal phosphate-dependent enzyme n=1 Tax=Rubritalea tangerina TaxID=430798 RepID=UPI0036238FA1